MSDGRRGFEQLGYADYDAYIDGSHWRSVRARYRKSARTQTCICGADGVLLHHKTYERLGAEHLSDLIPLCHACHEMVHALLHRGEFVNYSDFASLERANQYFDQNRRMIRQRQAEAPPSLEERVNATRYARAKARSKARRKRKPRTT